MSLPVMEFIRRFLQHVLPTGFMKIRYYGFMGAKPRVNREQVRALIELAFGFETPDPPRKKISQPALLCPECGSRLVLRYVTASLFGPARGPG